MNDRDKYTESKKNTERRIEIRNKFYEMSKSLIDEGVKNDDYSVITAGNLLGLLSGLVTEPKLIEEFNSVAMMFNAKILLDDMMKSGMSPFGSPDSDEDILGFLRDGIEPDSDND